jgi:MFS family permease
MENEIGSQKEIFQIRRIYVLLVLISTFFINFDSAVVIPILANFAVSLGASILLAGTIVGIYSVFHIPSNIILGRMVDKFGRKKFLVLGILMDGFSMLLYFLASNPTFLLVARIIHGLGGGFGGPASMSYLGDVSLRQKSGKAMAIYGISVGSSMLFGFLVGGMLASYVGYRNLFLIISIIMFIISLISLTLPISQKTQKIKFRLKLEIKGFLQIITKRKLIVPYLSILVIFFNLGVLTATYTIFLNHFAYNDAQIGMILSIMVIFSIIFHYPAGRLGDNIGKVKILIFGLFISAFGFIFLLISPYSPFPYIGMAIFGVGHGSVFPTSAAIVRDESSIQDRGIATGIFYALNVAGIAIGSPISGFIVQFFNFNLALLVSIFLPICIAIIIVILKLTKR